MPSTTLVWFQNDLRTHDHPALLAAAARGAVIPVHVDDADSGSTWREGAASRWWRLESLKSLDASLRQVGSRLIVARGEPASALRGMASQVGATHVHWTRRHEPDVRRQHDLVRDHLVAAGLEVEVHPGAVLIDPESVSTRAGTPYQVFTPFWRAVLEEMPGRTRIDPAPKRLDAPAHWPESLSIESLCAAQAAPWQQTLARAWTPGEAAARDRLADFLDEDLARYAARRDLPGVQGSSRLSPHLHFGELSVREVFEAVRSRRSGSAEKFLSEIGWREFAHHLLHHFPKSTDAPLRAEFEGFPWQSEPELEAAWRRGRTGIPIVDAGQRELWSTGWMHNRVRMISASFLVKNLGVHWLQGARWFWDTLVDADLANNTLGWQWTAGCGADAAPYFRIFNPVLQGQRFDPEGLYVRRWVPELAGVPDRFVHDPWRAPAPPRDYPAPIVDLRASRNEALRAYEEHRRKPTCAQC